MAHLGFDYSLTHPSDKVSSRPASARAASKKIRKALNASLAWILYINLFRDDI